MSVTVCVHECVCVTVCVCACVTVSTCVSAYMWADIFCLQL